VNEVTCVEYMNAGSKCLRITQNELAGIGGVARLAHVLNIPHFEVCCVIRVGKISNVVRIIWEIEMGRIFST